MVRHIRLMLIAFIISPCAQFILSIVPAPVLGLPFLIQCVPQNAFG